MFDGIDFSKMGEMVEQMQKKAKEIEEANANKEYSIKSGGGLVSIKINGNGEVMDLNIDVCLKIKKVCKFCSFQR